MSAGKLDQLPVPVQVMQVNGRGLTLADTIIRLLHVSCVDNNHRQ